eukprot:TRINITY_DN37649_c0_g1_i1.p1 TRINITY_DN37649_c0_g1~~TRINITY_DN37649_c0_g1_i1.p1  ORF type:complete len:267 (+),score=30.54 TRINITY_DN37649_c0_g1_i1:204-1004(+)
MDPAEDDFLFVPQEGAVRQAGSNHIGSLADTGNLGRPRNAAGGDNRLQRRRPGIKVEYLTWGGEVDWSPRSSSSASTCAASSGSFWRTSQEEESEDASSTQWRSRVLASDDNFDQEDDDRKEMQFGQKCLWGMNKSCRRDAFSDRHRQSEQDTHVAAHPHCSCALGREPMKAEADEAFASEEEDLDHHSDPDKDDCYAFSPICSGAGRRFDDKGGQSRQQQQPNGACKPYRPFRGLCGRPFIKLVRRVLLVHAGDHISPGPSKLSL